ncbi:hypothetical protein ACFLZ9_00775 [Patescibacteria group bacterium]
MKKKKLRNILAEIEFIKIYYGENIKDFTRFILFVIASGIFAVIGNAFGRVIIKFTQDAGDITKVPFFDSFNIGIKIGLAVGCIWMLIAPLFMKYIVDNSKVNDTIAIIYMVLQVALYIIALLIAGGYKFFF